MGSVRVLTRQGTRWTRDYDGGGTPPPPWASQGCGGVTYRPASASHRRSGERRKKEASVSPARVSATRTNRMQGRLPLHPGLLD
ncbi:hypothetical protein MRX96_044038 [Rhipicephalus microplus]